MIYTKCRRQGVGSMMTGKITYNGKLLLQRYAFYYMHNKIYRTLVRLFRKVKETISQHLFDRARTLAIIELLDIDVLLIKRIVIM